VFLIDPKELGESRFTARTCQGIQDSEKTNKGMKVGQILCVPQKQLGNPAGIRRSSALTEDQ
jgi:hypothetical protein